MIAPGGCATFRFGATTCRVGPTWVVTTLPDGSEVHAHPQDSMGQRQTAKALGYGLDLAAMTRDHDTLHAAIAAWVGLPESAALRQAAGGSPDPELAAMEEDAVLAVQRYCRAVGSWPWGAVAATADADPEAGGEGRSVDT